MGSDDDVVHIPECVVAGQGFSLENVERGTRDFPVDESLGQVGQIDDGPTADVDQVGSGLHQPELLTPKHLVCLGGVRGGDGHEVTVLQ